MDAFTVFGRLYAVFIDKGDVNSAPKTYQCIFII